MPKESNSRLVLFNTKLILAALATALAWDQPSSLAADLAARAPEFLNRPGWAGVGLNLGNVETGATAKLWASPRLAVQAALGNRPEGNALRLNVDLTYSPHEWRSADNQYALPFYVGLGGVLGHSFASGDRPASTESGFRVPFGMSILVRDNPIELFFEIAPEFTIRTSASPGRYTVYSDGAIGLRYYL
jgi:hypothetical protein